MIIVAGCGYLGERIADRLRASGGEVLGLTHTAESAQRLAGAKPWNVEVCDISDPAAVNALAANLGPASVEAFIHCASSNRGGADAYESVYVRGMENLLAAFPAAFPVFTSSTSVYPQTDGSRVDEESAANPERETGRLLRVAEEKALQRGGAVARLAGIYGPGRSFVLKNLLEGKAAIEGGDGAGRVLNQIHREDAASAIAHLLTGRLSGIYNVADNEPMTQRACYEKLAPKFGVLTPPACPPDPDRKRGWTSKRVANHKLAATGWTPRYADYLSALELDADIVPSVLAQLETPDARRANGAMRNVILIGLMGSGKSCIGRLVAQKLGFQLVDVDQLVVEAAGKSIPQLFEEEGEPAFRLRESAALRSLLDRTGCVIATGGGIVTEARNHPVLRRLGYIVWLEASPATLHRRTASSNDRPLLRDPDPQGKLEKLLEARRSFYQSLADLRIQTDDLSPEETAYGLAETVRVQFSQS